MKKLFLSLVLAVAIVSSACGSGGTEAKGPRDHNDQDVSFAQGMIPHHQQAVEMSDIVIEGGESPEVKALAEEIKRAQAPEIETLRGWLKDWDEPETPDSGGHAGMDMGGGDEMDMMSDEEMGELEAASGKALDRMFLEMMIRHHRGAIDMAETEVADGQFADAKKMAETIIETQSAEIEKMTALLETLAA